MGSRAAGAHFSEAALGFLRELKQNNEREWFGARKGVYEEELKGPMLAVIGAVNEGMLRFAPEHVRDPAKCMMRIYRDIRFSKDKRPYKVHVAAWWARQGLEKTSGGGFYFDLSGEAVTIAAGVYMPKRTQLLAIRRMLVERHEAYRTIMAGKRLRAAMQGIEPMAMTRVPKGFAADDPAADLVRQRQWGVSARLPVEVAVGPRLVREIVRRFELAAPLVAMLNEPLVGRVSRPLF